jgi:hypothetical protein
MPKIQLCRNGCNQYITVQEDQGKWKPFDVSDDGEVLDLHNCPNSLYNQQQGGVKTGQTSYIKKSIPSPTTTTQGGTSLDTKRIFNAIGELTEVIAGIKEKTIIDTNIYVQQTNQIYNSIAHLLNTTGEKASTLLKKERQDILDPTAINHGKKADEFERTKKFVNSEKEIDPEDSNIDTDEDLNDDNDEDDRIPKEED